MTREQLEKLQEIINGSKNIIFFGGAGVSTESGIPDFRSKDGLYNQHDIQFEEYEPEYLLSHECLAYNPKVFYEFYRQKMDARGFEPNITHKVLAEMEAMGKLSAVITQNIDGLHQKAGSKNVIELHGTTKENYCKNHCEIDPDFIFENKDPIPKCPHCGKPARPNVVLYGEELPKKAIGDALTAISDADCMIIGGTSLCVYPASYYVTYFKGDHLIIINREEIPWRLDEKNDLQINDSLGCVFAEIEKML